ncbi:unnamed protein product [Medioppia subpectinata]|uniref:C2H2-type domain-containing protein n=1 Tax=Medioppia subpectinata TaxID=1979941 RepID=A0A7R9Q6X4_9ACAR|nr:unnamed protein product [Medioppia subpectinata]CAG2114189.1 unnamed protein product [Medioppia subpectinata]
MNPFKCKEKNCDKRFANEYLLNAHKRNHSGEKPFVCDFNGCNASFKRVSHLSQHKKNCGKKFISNAKLNEHKLLHSGERPFDCGGSYASNRYLQRHVRECHKK